MSRILELDVFAPANAIVRYKGQEYEVLPVKVESLLKVIRSVQALQGSTDTSVEASGNAMQEIMDFIKQNVPTIPADDLSFGAIVALIQFIAEAGGEQAKQGIQAVQTAEEAQKKTSQPESESPTP